MIKNVNIKQNAINVIVLLVCIIIIASGKFIISNLSNMKTEIKNDIETEWRTQAKRTLANIQDQFTYDINHNMVDPANEESLQTWAKRNISGLLNGGATGDTFMINLSNEKFLWDGSKGCDNPEFITNGRYMSGEAEMHVDTYQANLIIDKMKLGSSTLNTHDKNWWNFDGSIEYLEWVVIPPGFLGFDKVTVDGIEKPKYNKVLIALGTQEDEVFSTFDNTLSSLDRNILFTKIFTILSTVICVFNMIIYVFLNKQK